MYFLIVDCNNGELLFSTFQLRFKENLSQYVYDFYNSKENKLIHDYQIGIQIKNDFIFAIINPIGEVWSRKVTDDILHEILKRFIKILTEKEYSILLSKDKGKIYEIGKRMEKDFFQWDISIRLIGGIKVGTTTILNEFYGLTNIDLNECQNIPYNRIFGQKRIMLKEYLGSDRYFIGINRLKFDNYIILILDSLRSLIELNQNHFIITLKQLKKINNNKKLLIIANKQDLPNAMTPENIERITELKTVGFSAVASDAPEKLEKIISEFVKDN